LDALVHPELPVRPGDEIPRLNQDPVPGVFQLPGHYIDSLAATSTEKLDGQLGDGLESINFLIPGGCL
jgi:hypothetical protein